MTGEQPKSDPPAIAFLIGYGPEVRAFLYSGLADELARTYKVCAFWRQYVSHISENITNVVFPSARDNKVLGFSHSIALRAQQAWLKSTGKSLWNHYLPRDGARHSAIAGSPKAVKWPSLRRGLFTCATVVERGLSWATGRCKAWERNYKTYNIQCVIGATYAGPYILPALRTAKAMGIRVIILTNSWKDVYSTTYLPIIPDCIGVWNEMTKSHLLSANPFLPLERVKTLPSLHLQHLLNLDTASTSRSDSVATGLPAGTRYICYTAAAPRAVIGEEHVVEHLLDILKDDPTLQDVKVLLRLNPMEDGARFTSMQKAYMNLVIQKPHWVWKPEADWCYALPSDIEVWTDTIRNSIANVSIPSTVTQEFLCIGRPVINICYDGVEGVPAAFSNKRFWESGFYRQMHGAKLVYPAFSKDDLKKAVKNILSCAQILRSTPDFSAEGLPVARAVEIVQQVMNK